MTALKTIDLDQLALITGGQGPGDQGTYERVGEKVGGALGTWGAGMVPPKQRPMARAVMPPAGRALGAELGRRFDGWMGESQAKPE
jgi:hypothetical protein